MPPVPKTPKNLSQHHTQSPSLLTNILAIQYSHKRLNISHAPHPTLISLKHLHQNITHLVPHSLPRLYTTKYPIHLVPTHHTKIVEMYSYYNPHAYLSIKHYTLHIHKPHPKNHLYSKLKSHTTHQLHPNNKMASDYRLLHTTNNERHTQNNNSNHNIHPNFNHHTKPNYQLKFTSYSNYNPHPTNTLASAYRPRHTYHNTYTLTNNWKPTLATSHTPINHTQSHFPFNM